LCGGNHNKNSGGVDVAGHNNNDGRDDDGFFFYQNGLKTKTNDHNGLIY